MTYKDKIEEFRMLCKPLACVCMRTYNGRLVDMPESLKKLAIAEGQAVEEDLNNPEIYVSISYGYVI